jgi:hypothetical protein
MRVPDAVQREAKRNGASLIRDRPRLRVRNGPGSAPQHFRLRAYALRRTETRRSSRSERRRAVLRCARDTVTRRITQLRFRILGERPSLFPRRLVVSWIATTCRPATRVCVRAASPAISPTVTLGLRRNRVIGILPARPPPSERTAMPRRPTSTSRRCRTAPFFRSAIPKPPQTVLHRVPPAANHLPPATQNRNSDAILPEMCECHSPAGGSTTHKARRVGVIRRWQIHPTPAPSDQVGGRRPILSRGGRRVAHSSTGTSSPKSCWRHGRWRSSASRTMRARLRGGH